MNENPNFIRFDTGIYMGHAMDSEVEIGKYNIGDGYFLPISRYRLFHWERPMKGDFICRKMQSGNIGLFQCQENFTNVDYSSLTSFGPRDHYEGKVVFCGYLNGNTAELIKGYKRV
jgi:hypothetical protein